MSASLWRPIRALQIPQHRKKKKKTPFKIKKKKALTMPPKKKEEAPPARVILGRISGHLKMGLLGPPNVGKSSTFNLLTKMGVPAEK
jgi:ribosome biogenesis GTPase A